MTRFFIILLRKLSLLLWQRELIGIMRFSNHTCNSFSIIEYTMKTYYQITLFSKQTNTFTQEFWALPNALRQARLVSINGPLLLLIGINETQMLQE